MLLCALATAAMTASAESFTAKVTAVPEGDILTIHRVGAIAPEDLRLYGIDCPEPGQPMNDEAKQFSAEKALNQTVTVEVLATDNQGKLVGVVTLDGEVKLHQALLAAGLAWWDSENTPDERDLRGQCATAVTAPAGLWKDPAPLSPWDYRRSHNLPAVTYSVKKEDVKPVEKPKEETKVLAAKGDEVYKGGFSVNVADIKFDQEVNPQELLMKHTPTIARDDAGKPLGVAVPNIGSIPYASQLGFQEGDIITGVNGQAITDMSQIMGMYQQFQGAKQLNVGIMRGGRPTNIRINLP
jgi:endonuclease YncB( thermonuclease family)